MNYKIPVSDNTIEQYDMLLSRFSDWKSYKREIKLNTLLESGKKIEFKVDIENHQFGGLYIDIIDDYEDNWVSLNLKNACCVLTSMTFIIKNFIVIDLVIEFKILETSKGKMISDLFNSNVELEIIQKIQGNDVLGFSFKLPKKAA